MSGPRVVSLLPSATEIVCALGARDLLVGRSHECDYPPGVERLPALTRPRLDPGASSREIDRAARRLVEQGLSLYEVDAERLRALRPDVIVTQTLCSVCAVTPDDLRTAVEEWTGMTPVLLSLEARRLDDVLEDPLRVGAVLGREEDGRELVRHLRARAEAVRVEFARRPVRPRVACIEWLDPPMVAGHWMPDLVERAGGASVLARAGEPSRWIAWEDLEREDPDVVALAPCGLDLEATRREAARVSERLRGLRAVREGRAYALDGSALFNRPGPRLVASLELLAALLHGGAPEPGAAWAPLQPNSASK